jgi:hypothetical protein
LQYVPIVVQRSKVAHPIPMFAHPIPMFARLNLNCWIFCGQSPPLDQRRLYYLSSKALLALFSCDTCGKVPLLGSHVLSCRFCMLVSMAMKIELESFVLFDGFAGCCIEEFWRRRRVWFKVVCDLLLKYLLEVTEVMFAVKGLRY